MRYLLVVMIVMLGPSYAWAQAMRAHYISVGQADSTLLEFPCGAILIDAGTDQGNEHRLLEYLEQFFERRDDLNNTLDSIVTTHAHIDHTRALREVVEQFTVLNYVDNGRRDSRTGGGDPRWITKQIDEGDLDITLRSVSDEEIQALGHRRGLTDSTIDPIECDDCDPQIHILSGGHLVDPGWGPGEFDNENNHSLVVRIDFGESSFLFTGDLEEHAIETLVDYYDGSDSLDVDIYQVGHHGSHNGTTESLMLAMTPHASVCSMGRWFEGRKPDGSARMFTTYAYGHPRLSIVRLLEDHIPGRRSNSRWIYAANRPRDYERYEVRRRVYATGWDGTVIVRATLERRFRITVENHAY